LADRRYWIAHAAKHPLHVLADTERVVLRKSSEARIVVARARVEQPTLGVVVLAREAKVVRDRRVWVGRGLPKRLRLRTPDDITVRWKINLSPFLVAFLVSGSVANVCKGRFFECTFRHNLGNDTSACDVLAVFKY
jgi:hypothetical protein